MKITPMKKRAFLYLDILSWLESHLEGKTCWTNHQGKSKTTNAIIFFEQFESLKASFRDKYCHAFLLALLAL